MEILKKIITLISILWIVIRNLNYLPFEYSRSHEGDNGEEKTSQKIEEIKSRYGLPKTIDSEKEAKIFKDKLEILSIGNLIGSKTKRILLEDLEGYEDRQIIAAQKKLAKNRSPNTNKIKAVYPKEFQRGRDSTIRVYIYVPIYEYYVDREINELNNIIKTSPFATSLKPRDKVQVSIISSQLEFIGQVEKEIILEETTRTIFACKPKDNSNIGKHEATLIINDQKNNNEVFSASFTIKIVDYAFAKVPRYIVSSTLSSFSLVGGFALWYLSFVEKIDAVLGLSSGTAAFLSIILVFKITGTPFPINQEKNLS